MQLKKYWYYGLFTILVVIFCYFRIKPILLQSVPYTFDQGRDFLKTERIITEHHLAFYGPPAGGLNGLSHGVWWYYELLIPYILGNGNPIGFSYYIFGVTLISILLFTYFLFKKFNIWTALVFIAIIAASPYAILSSFFPINSVMTIPFLLLLTFSFYQIISTKNELYAFLFWFSAGFVFEAEVPFGLFLFPALLLLLIITNSHQYFWRSKKHIYFSLGGLFFPFIPRVLTEFAGKFRQTQALFQYFINPTEPVSAGQNILLERFHQFSDYYLSLFPESNVLLAVITLAITIIGGIVLYKNKNKVFRRIYLFSILLPISLFLLSLLSKKRFFWSNYFEGMPYLLLLPAIYSTYILSISTQKTLKMLAYGFVIVQLLVCVVVFAKDTNSHDRIKLDGLAKQVAVMKTIYAVTGKQTSCIRIYTPPVIPYTYEYLFHYFEKKGFPTPTNLYVNNRCYYIIESDEYQFRIDNWKKENIPSNATRISKKNITSDIVIELWQENQKTK